MLLEMERIASRANTHIEQRTIGLRSHPVVSLVLAEVPLFNFVFSRFVANPTDERVASLTVVVVANGATKRV